MQQIEIPNRVLLAVAERMLNIRAAQNIDDFIFSILLNSKLKDWHKDNSIRIKTLSEKIHKLRKQYFVYDKGIYADTDGEKDKEVMKMQPGKQILVTPAKMNGDEIIEDAVYQDGPLEPVCLEGKTVDEFNVKYNELMEAKNIMVF